MAQEYDSAYTQYQLDRSLPRRAVRSVYLWTAARLIHGPTLDFGCGVGELLRQLPEGSRGVEYNQATVEHCRRQGLPVDYYDGTRDDWTLSSLPAEQTFESMVLSHVLEHLEDPIDIFCKLLPAAAARGISRVLVIVPGRAGFRIDDTHVTFVDRGMLEDEEIPARTGFRCVRGSYFPGNVRGIGDWFPHHELRMVFVRDP